MSFEVKTDLAWHGQDVMIRGRKAVNKSAYEIGLVVEGQAKELCKVRTGYLRGSINTQAAGKGTSPEPAKDGRVAPKIDAPRDDQEVLVGTAADYGPYIEFGVLTGAAQPFLRPALDLATGKAIPITQKNAKMEFADYLNPRAT